VIGRQLVDQVDLGGHGQHRPHHVGALHDLVSALGMDDYRPFALKWGA